MIDIAIITAIIAAVFAGVLGLLKVVLPYIKKSPETHRTPAPRISDADRPGAFNPPPPQLEYGDLPDTGRKIDAILTTLTDINSKDFATTDAMNRLSDTVSKRLDHVEKDVASVKDSHTSMVGDLAFIRGKLDK